MTKDNPHSQTAVIIRCTDAAIEQHNQNPRTLGVVCALNALQPGDILPNGLEVGEEWVSVKKRRPDYKEPIVYARPRDGKWAVGIAYWTVSKKWMPEMESQQAPGFTYWKPLGAPPRQR